MQNIKLTIILKLLFIFLFLLFNPFKAYGKNLNNISILKNKTIILDPGHGGNDSGAIRYNIKESELNLKVALKLKQYLNFLGANVILTRDSNLTISLDKRYEVSLNNSNAHLFISLHHNDANDIFYQNKNFTNYSEIFFSPIYNGTENIKATLAFYQAFLSLYKINKVKIKPANFKVIRNSNIPSLLIEPFFLGDNKIALLANTKEYINHEALTYLKAILLYFNTLNKNNYNLNKHNDLNKYCFKHFDVFFNIKDKNNSINTNFLNIVSNLLNVNKITNIINTNENFLKINHISEYYILKLKLLENYLDLNEINEYTEIIRSNAVNAKIHILFNISNQNSNSIEIYYKSTNGYKLAQLLLNEFKKWGIAFNINKTSSYILSTTSAVTLIININSKDLNLLNKNIKFKFNIALFKAIKEYLKNN